jgi:hypothetical protein
MLASAGQTVLTVILAAVIVVGWIVLAAIYVLFFRRRGS